MIYYVIDDDDCKYEGMTKEQILSAIEQGLAQGYVSDPDSAVFSKIKEIRANAATQIWVGTEAQFNAIFPAPAVGKSVVRVGTDGVLYLCSDDSTLNDLSEHLNDTNNPHDVTLDQLIGGNTLPVKNGGTGASDAATARNNLGVTPANIGAATASHGHNLQDLSGTVPISKGGTGANNATDALANLGAFRFLGDNVISSTNNDTTSKWGALGSGYAFFNSNGLLNDQPSTWGIVVSFVTGSDIFQMWRAQTTGPTYWRSGNASGWNGTWNKVYDTANKPAFGDLDGQPTPILSSTDVSAVERTQYTYIGNALVMSGITPEVECANNAVTSYSVWFPKTFTSGCTVMASLYYNNDESGSAAHVNAVAGWYQNNTMVIKFSNTSGATRKLRASWLAIGM